MQWHILTTTVLKHPGWTDRGGGGRGGGGENAERTQGSGSPGPCRQRGALPLQSGRARTCPRVACLRGDHTGSAQGCMLISLEAIYNHSEITLGELCRGEQVNYSKGSTTRRVKEAQTPADCMLSAVHLGGETTTCTEKAPVLRERYREGAYLPGNASQGPCEQAERQPWGWHGGGVGVRGEAVLLE